MSTQIFQAFNIGCKKKHIDLFQINDRIFFTDASINIIPKTSDEPQPFHDLTSQEVLLKAADKSRNIDSDRPPGKIPLIYEIDKSDDTYIFQTRYGHSGLLNLLDWDRDINTTTIHYKLVGPDPMMPTPYTKQLANGIEVELLSISTHPSNAKSWWDPHGNVLEDSPYDDHFSEAHPREGEKGYTFALKISELAGRDIDICWNPMSFGTVNHGGGISHPSEKDGKTNSHHINNMVNEVIIYQGAAIAEGRQSCHISIGICPGEWKQDYWHKYSIDPTNKAVNWIIFRNVALQPRATSAAAPKKESP